MTIKTNQKERTKEEARIAKICFSCYHKGKKAKKLNEQLLFFKKAIPINSNSQVYKMLVLQFFEARKSLKEKLL